MTSLTFILPTGEIREFAVQECTTAMQVARLNGVAGIEAECAGALSCGTCHVYVEDADIAKLPAPSDQELEMLDLVAAERKPTSRLCCQIHLDSGIQSLVLQVPDTQY
ncbi:2Fe-2S iron-sulfur cluster-binding protein [Acidovorax sp. SDU_ACID1]|uniref:2Fe-2S iron-sulfur cluster-binding protein n=1 Tax=Acidovorax sp. SDU_ACID1 TaxID=3136632 RepID=UPI003873837A